MVVAWYFIYLSLLPYFLCYQGSIPPEIGKLFNLTHMRLSFNLLVNTVPTELGQLKRLELLHFHGNRLLGEISGLNVQNQEPSSFISDCGVPSNLVESVTCEKCSMCCKYSSFDVTVHLGFVF